VDDQGFTRFVTDEASVANGLVLLVTDDLDATGEIVEAAWPDVHRRWPVIAASRHPRANAFAPVVARAVRYAEANAPAPATSGGTLELRDDVVMDVASFGGRPERVPSRGSTAAEDEADPADRAVLQAFHDLAPRERALVALTVLAGLDEKELPWAVRWRPPRAALVAGRAVRDLMLTSAPLVVGQVADPSASTAMQTRVVRVLQDEAGRAAVDGPETAARVTPALAGAPQRRPLPRPGRGWLVAAAAVVVVLLAAFVVQLRDDEPSSQAADPPPAPKAEAGYQLVGYRGVYTSVPSSWSHNQLECGQPVANTVIYPDASSGCFGEVRIRADVPPSSVTFSDLPTSAVPLGRLRRVNQVGDLGVYATTPVHREGLVHEIVLVPQANVQMIVRGTDIHVMDDIVDSLQPVPDGYAVVPPCQRLKLRVAIKQLDDAGLGVTLIQASTLSGREREPPVTRQTIASGTLVADGTSVGLGFPSTD
jgi:hypothetical protein